MYLAFLDGDFVAHLKLRLGTDRIVWNESVHFSISVKCVWRLQWTRVGLNV